MALNLETDRVLGPDSVGYYHWPHNQGLIASLALAWRLESKKNNNRESSVRAGHTCPEEGNPPWHSWN